MLSKIEWPDDPYQFLVAERFGSREEIDPFRSAMFPDSLNPSAAKKQEAVEAYRAELDNLPTEEILERVRELVDQKNAEIIDSAKKRDELSFFSQPHVNANFDQWAGLKAWHQCEAAALSFGKCPRSVNPETLYEYRESSWFAQNYFSLVGLIERDLFVQCELGSLKPITYVTWADKNSIDIPQELAAAVLAKSQKADNAAVLSSDVEKQGSLSTREKDTLLTIIATMAAQKYGYTPLKKNQAAGKIVTEMEKMGLEPLSSETVRKKLKEASELVPQRFFTKREKD